MDELIIDSFAGGGGASLGITWALGRHPDVAINHDAAAITMHKANHPTTTHYTEDVWKLSPRQVTGGKPVGLLWASPDCKHFSRAKGAKPVEKKIRSLAWVVVRWAVESKPRLIMLENVREFEEWGPLVPRWVCRNCSWKGTEGQATLERQRRTCPHCDSLALTKTAELMPDPDRKGLTFKRFTGRLRNLGYEIQWRVLNAADYGAPTHRRRLFLIARRDGGQIVWPTPTHGDPKRAEVHGLLPWRMAAQCIDWTLPCPSIFDRKKPLVAATLRRIAHGIKRYVLDNPRPFIVDMPLGTVTMQGNRFNLVTPYMVRCNHGGEHFRGQSVEQSMCTLTASRDAHAVITPVLSKYHGQKVDEDRCQSPGAPIKTLDTQNRYGVIAPTLIQTSYGERPGQAPRQLNLFAPLGTVVAGGTKHAMVAAYLAKHFGGVVGVPVDTPLPTTPARGTQNQVVTANLVHLNHGEKQWAAVDEPLRAIVAGGNHAFLVYSFLVKYFGTAIGQAVDEPLHTITEKDRFGVVTVEIDGMTYVMVDIGMRMLTPRELARCQGFPDSYLLTGSNTNQVAKIGNSVSPQPAMALVKENFSVVTNSVGEVA
jgi:DNA (cytosine-5)-methyltransferase 1